MAAHPNRRARALWWGPGAALLDTIRPCGLACCAIRRAAAAGGPQSGAGGAVRVGAGRYSAAPSALPRDPTRSGAPCGPHLLAAAARRGPLRSPPRLRPPRCGDRPAASRSLRSLRSSGRDLAAASALRSLARCVSASAPRARAPSASLRSRALGRPASPLLPRVRPAARGAALPAPLADWAASGGPLASPATSPTTSPTTAPTTAPTTTRTAPGEDDQDNTEDSDGTRPTAGMYWKIDKYSSI